jgi:hypothetical protein
MKTQEAFGFNHFCNTGGMISNLNAAYSLEPKSMWKLIEAPGEFMGYCIDAPEVMPAGSHCDSFGKRMGTLVMRD